MVVAAGVTADVLAVVLMVVVRGGVIVGDIVVDDSRVVSVTVVLVLA